MISEAVAVAQPAVPVPPAPAAPPVADVPPVVQPPDPAPAPAAPGGLATPSAPAGEPITVTGRVVDSLNRAVRGAQITTDTVPAPVVTDRDGRFTIVAPVGAILLVTAEQHEAALATVAGPVIDEVVLLLDLSSEKIEIGDEAPTAATGAARLGREQLQRLPGTGGDVVKTLNAMPGVVNTQLPLGYSGVVIRGSSPQDSKVLVDDFEIPLLFHPLGIRAILPAESVQSLTFIPGGFDVSHGRSSSGIVKLTTRPGSDSRSAQAEVSLVDGGLIAQGPLGERTRYMLALRRSVIDFVLPLVIPDSVDLSLTTVPQYWDEQMRIDHELDSRWTLSVSSIGTQDIFELFTSKDEDAGSKRFFSRTQFLRLTTAANYHEGEWQANLGLSGMISDLTAEIGLHQRLSVQTGLVTPRAVVTRTMPAAAGLKDVVWSAGAEAQIGYSDTLIAIPLERREGEPFPAYDPKDTSTSFEGSVVFPDYAAWSSIAATFDSVVRVTAGLRADYFGRPRELALQPRTEVQLKLARPLVARLAAGLYRRPPEFQSEFLVESLKSERSGQLTLGLEYMPMPGVRIQGSTYYTDRTRLITRIDGATLGNNGRGTSKGYELLAMLYTGEWFGWLGYSYSNSQREDTPGGARRLFDYDQPHSLNMAASWRRGSWQVGARFQLYSGLPFTPVVGAEFDSDRNLHLPIPGQVNTGRAPVHHQVDIRVDYNWKWGGTAWVMYLDVQNVYLDRSIVTYFYSYDYSQRSAFESLPLLPSAGMRVVL